MTKNNLKVVKSAKEKDTESKEKNKALEAAISQITCLLYTSPSPRDS